MRTFKAFRLLAGDKEPVRTVAELTVDDLSPGNVVIQIAYSSINYKDALASKGLNAIIRTWPRITGIDFVGTVIDSADVRFKAGDGVVVHGFGMGVDHDGGHAQVARVNADWVMPLPKGLSLFEAGVIGAAGFTAMYSLHLMELNGLQPSQGSILVNGATGGVASVAIDILSGRGYHVTAMTGKAHETDYLKKLGAAEVIGRVEPQANPKPLEKAQWAGAIDSVGGSTLAWLTRTVKPEGVIAAFGNAGGLALETTVLPFILRGVRLLGVNANPLMPLRQKLWDQIANDYRPTHLNDIARVISIDELPTYLDLTLAGQIRGRTVVDMSG